MGPRAIAVAVAPVPLPPEILTEGTDVYPSPPSTTVIPVTEPFVICAVADAWLSESAPPPVIETIGDSVYPVPPLVTLIAITDAFTLTEAAALSPSYFHCTVPKVCIPLVCVGSIVDDVVPVVSAW